MPRKGYFLCQEDEIRKSDRAKRGRRGREHLGFLIPMEAKILSDS